MVATGLELTVNDVLGRDLFRHSRVVAGHNGLNRRVGWTHILETKEFDTLINGGELILTTGSGLNLDSIDGNPCHRLIKKNVAGLCIEKGKYFSELPEEIAQLANEHHFPIIVFDKLVKFVDITQDLHSLIINQHHQKLHELSERTKEFTQLSLSHNGILKIVKRLHEYFRTNTFFMMDETKSYYHPPENKQMDERIRFKMKEWKKKDLQQKVIRIDDETFAVCPVIGLGQVWGHLCIQVNDAAVPDDFFFSIVDRASLAMAQILLRNRTIEERKLKSENELVRNLIRGKEYDPETLESFLTVSSNNLYFRVIVIKTGLEEIYMGDEDWEEVKLKRSMMIRSLFKQFGIFAAISVREHEITVICSFISTEELMKEARTFTEIAAKIHSIDSKNILEGNKCSVGVGGVCKNIDEVSKSYEEAKEMLTLKDADVITDSLYEQAGIYRLLLPLKESGKLEEYVEDYIGPLIAYDLETGSDLLTTLTVYLECSCSKKEAAEKLYIVRQTLYHRLEKIKQLVSGDFTKGEARLPIETAIKAYQLLKSN